MSGDTPTMECPECSWSVLPSADGLWAEDREPEYCLGCGSLVGLSLDDGDPDGTVARARLLERGGEVVARLLEEIEHLQTRPAQGVSAHLRARVAEACGVGTAGEAGCVAKACIPGHQAGDLLDAYDDARAEVERLTDQLAQDDSDRKERLTHEHSQEVLGLQSNAAAVKVQHDARVERAHADRLTAISFAGECKGELIVANRKLEETIARAETADLEAAVAQREVCERRARDHSPRYSGNEQAAKRARAIAKAEGWGCYPEDSTDRPAPAEPGNPEVAWSALRIAAARLGSVTVHGVDVDLHAAVDMALGEVRGEPEGDQ